MPTTPFITNLRSVLDQAREIGGKLGMRQWQITLIVQTWSGELPGTDDEFGNKSSLVRQDVFPIKVGVSMQDPPTRKISQRDVIASGSKYQDKDIVVKFAKPYYVSPAVNKSFDITSFDPTVAIGSIQTFYVVSGPESTSPQIYKKVDQNADKNLGFEITLRNTGRTYTGSLVSIP